MRAKKLLSVFIVMFLALSIIALEEGLCKSNNPNAHGGNPNAGGGNPNAHGGNPNAGGGNPSTDNINNPPTGIVNNQTIKISNRDLDPTNGSIKSENLFRKFSPKKLGMANITVEGMPLLKTGAIADILPKIINLEGRIHANVAKRHGCSTRIR